MCPWPQPRCNFVYQPDSSLSTSSEKKKNNAHDPKYKLSVKLYTIRKPFRLVGSRVARILRIETTCASCERRFGAQL